MNQATAPANIGIPTTDPQAAVHYTPVPGWVRHDPPPATGGLSLDDFTDQGVVRVLHETQLSLIESGHAIHLRVLQRVLTRAGAERAASLALEFDPAYERLEVHSILVRRGQTSTEHAAPGAMQLLRRESQLERKELNGRLTASCVIPDLREGDELEVSFTQFCFRQALSGRFASWLAFNAYAPWLETRIRLLRPLARQVALKAFNTPPGPVSAITAGIEDIRWSMVRQQRQQVEDLMPSWTVKSPCYQASEFNNWQEVAGLFTPHYLDDSLPAEAATARDSMALAHTDQATLAVEWLRFVQRSLRYFALSFGEGGLLPSDLDTIWARRFGDCKDAARFYVAGARSLGLDACAALVSTTHGQSLAEFLPSPQVFNHVIVRLQIAGQTFWLDPTLPLQAGSLQQLIPPHAGWALPLTVDTTALEALPAAEPVQVVHIDDRIVLGPRPDSTAQLTRRVELGFWMADNIRHQVANSGVSKLSAGMLQELSVSWPQCVETSAPTLQEDTATNKLTVLCSYQLPHPWKPAADQKRLMLSLKDATTSKELKSLQINRRHSPILLGRPRRISWHVTVELPGRWWGKGWNKPNDAGFLRFWSILDFGRKTIEIDRILIIDAWSMPAEQAENYQRFVKAVNADGIILYARQRFGRIVSPTNPLRWVLSKKWGRWLLIVAFWITIAIFNTLLSRK